LFEKIIIKKYKIELKQFINITWIYAMNSDYYYIVSSKLHISRNLKQYSDNFVKIQNIFLLHLLSILFNGLFDRSSDYRKYSRSFMRVLMQSILIRESNLINILKLFSNSNMLYIFNCTRY